VTDSTGAVSVLLGVESLDVADDVRRALHDAGVPARIRHVRTGFSRTARN
jgi:hypothetical protein